MTSLPQWPTEKCYLCLKVLHSEPHAVHCPNHPDNRMMKEHLEKPSKGSLEAPAAPTVQSIQPAKGNGPDSASLVPTFYLNGYIFADARMSVEIRDDGRRALLVHESFLGGVDMTTVLDYPGPKGHILLIEGLAPVVGEICTLVTKPTSGQMKTCGYDHEVSFTFVEKK